MVIDAHGNWKFWVESYPNIAYLIVDIMKYLDSWLVQKVKGAFILLFWIILSISTKKIWTAQFLFFDISHTASVTTFESILLVYWEYLTEQNKSTLKRPLFKRYCKFLPWGSSDWTVFERVSSFRNKSIWTLRLDSKDFWTLRQKDFVTLDNC